MPELPDLEVFSLNLNKKLAGRKLDNINILKNARKNLPSARIKKALEKQKLSKVYREGKELHFRFDNNNVLGIHLMLKGQLHWFNKKNDQKFTLVEMYFGNIGVAMTDYQRSARITLNPEATTIPDAMSTDANLDFWKKTLQSKARIKNLLLDQKIVRGIGNAYADEILWQAGISPFSIANKIPALRVKKLASAIKKVLKHAVRQIRKADPGIIGGEIRSFLSVHHGKKKFSPTGALIRKKSIGGRKTYYTGEQELYT